MTRESAPDAARSTAARTDVPASRPAASAVEAPDAPPGEPGPPGQHGGRGLRRRLVELGDGFFFVFAGLAAVWLAWLVLSESIHLGWFAILYVVAVWLVIAYLALPRLHRILTTLYVPEYFIGRTRTANGLLGDPVNLALLGEESQVRAAMEAAGWTLADDVTLASSGRIVAATLSRRSYDQAPVSPLFLFGRQQDFAFQQEVEGNPSRRHHIRFWRCPPGWPLPGGRRVDWLAAGTYDRSVGFSLFTLQVTHKIEADTDQERDHVVATLLGADVGVDVEVIEDFSTGYHARNGGGDAIRTDGDLPVADVRGVAAPGPPAASASLAAGPDGAGGATKRAAQRPAATTVGALLVVLGVVADLIWLANLALHWEQTLRSLFLGGDVTQADIDQASGPLLVLVVVLLSLVALFQLFLAWRVYLGRNWARDLVMVLAAISTTSSFVGWAVSGNQITFRTTLLTVALDILVLLTLSSRDAAAYAKSRRELRLERRAARRG
ncbi:LssY C-terminal domain-containing protein [Oerskovia turbata]|uniref:LssY C-terminal domain-containing protein n=1 Tax=Oerskovia turbata TaxID=1713 RepID=UPI000A52DB47|nr:LssY C-terminal domain-containing protein [Oerskovia turbata]